MSETFDFQEKSKGSSRLCQRPYPVDRGTMDYRSIQGWIWICLDLTVRRKKCESVSPQCVDKTVKFGRASVMVCGMISLTGVTSSPACSLSHLRKRTVETPIFMQGNTPCNKAKTVNFSWRGRNRYYEVITTKPRYESYRESMENHRRESEVPKSSKYCWFMGFSERRMGKYHNDIL